ncbi:MAG: hypothetical protein LBG19_02725 [Prevotellaceae bacterium]|jgi:hypothetical protein|nr:hypothetical protein [Prevotellaceae bacterium]
MKKLLVFSLFVTLMACTSGGSNGTFKEPAYMSLNGQINSIEITHFSDAENANNPLGDFGE